MQNVTPQPPRNPLHVLGAIIIVILVLGGIWSLFRGSPAKMYGPHMEYDPQMIKVARTSTEIIRSGKINAWLGMVTDESKEKITVNEVAKGKQDLEPLGRIIEIEETTPPENTDHLFHVFHLRFEHGMADEMFRVAPNGKIIKFRYRTPIYTH